MVMYVDHIFQLNCPASGLNKRLEHNFMVPLISEKTRIL